MCSLLALGGDVLRNIAFWLRPRDRLNLALCCRRLFDETWGAFASEDLTNRFPFERRLEFDLDVEYNPETCVGSPLGPAVDTSQEDSRSEDQICDALKNVRVVPERSRMQHCYVAVSSTGTTVAVLAYDNILRLVSSLSKRVLSSICVGPTCATDIWDKSRGKRVVNTALASDPTAGFEEERGVDVEIGFDFTDDGKFLILSNKHSLTVFSTADDELRVVRRLTVAEALRNCGQDHGVGGSSCISPDGSSAIWVVFANRPAVVWITFWDLATGECTKVSELATIQPRRWSALGWARVKFSPNGRYVVAIVNNAKKMSRWDPSSGSCSRIKLCEYVFAVYDWHDVDADRGSEAHGSSTEALRVMPFRRRSEWLDLSPASYPQNLACCTYDTVRDLDMGHEPSAPERSTQHHRRPSLHFNFVHSCPSEATYKALYFGIQTRHPWFVTKQPMYSMHLSEQKDRMIVATSPHANDIFLFVRNGEGQRPPLIPAPTTPMLPDGAAANRRTHAFHSMPWRTGFATVCAFSANGKWLAGATLLEDQCIVCVRNLTVHEY